MIFVKIFEDQFEFDFKTNLNNLRKKFLMNDNVDRNDMDSF